MAGSTGAYEAVSVVAFDDNEDFVVLVDMVVEVIIVNLVVVVVAIVDVGDNVDDVVVVSDFGAEIVDVAGGGKDDDAVVSFIVSNVRLISLLIAHLFTKFTF